MISVDCLNISLNRTLLLLVGLWPYQQSKLVQFQIILVITILTTCIIFQFTAFLTSKCTPDLFINVFSSALFFLLFLIQYAWFSINTKVYLLDRLLNIYNDLTDKNEIRIMEEYGSYARRYTIGLISKTIALEFHKILSVCFVLKRLVNFCSKPSQRMCILLSLKRSLVIVIIFAPVLILYPFWPHIFDILLSINESSSRPSLKGIYVSEYFIDQEKYFNLILLHGNAALFLGIVTLLGTGTLLIANEQYACGMFRIASYRLEQALAVDTLRKNNSRNKNLIHNKLIHAVDMHREAMKFSDSSVSKFKIMFAFMIVTGVISAILNFFRLFQALLFGYDAEELLLPLLSVIIYISYIFVGDYVAQEVMDHNNDVFATAYNIQWYTASLNVQKMILFLLQRSTKDFNLNIAGLIIGSLEGAASLLSTTLSYFTVLYSIRT
ncbi:hypothetical protein ACFW04_009378 [Cataglyphis niger]